jgi:hypothetical protein
MYFRTGDFKRKEKKIPSLQISELHIRSLVGAASLSSTRLCSVNAQFLVQGQKTAFKLIICDHFFHLLSGSGPLVKSHFPSLMLLAYYFCLFSEHL